MTPAETQLWNSLKNRQLYGKKFRRQHGIGPYVVDFFCPAERLIIELDGEGHNSPQNREYDAQRQEYLHKLGFSVLRFENKQVFEDIDNVLTCICNVMSLSEYGK